MTDSPDDRAVVGVISDTHGSLSEIACDALSGVDAILHAGDVGGPDVLLRLSAIAPVSVARGNTDAVIPGWDLPPMARVTIAGVRFVIVHQLGSLGAPEGVDVVVYGHTHRPECSSRGNVLFFNPGSAQEPLESYPPRAVGRLTLDAGRVLDAQHIPLRTDAAPRP